MSTWDTTAAVGVIGAGRLGQATVDVIEPR